MWVNASVLGEGKQPKGHGVAREGSVSLVHWGRQVTVFDELVFKGATC